MLKSDTRFLYSDFQRLILLLQGLLLIFLLPTPLFAQTARIDSLKNQLFDNQPDQEKKIERLLVLAGETENLSEQECQMLVLEAWQLSKKELYQKGMIQASKMLGYSYKTTNKLDSALQFAQLFYEEAAISRDSQLIAEGANLIGSIFNVLGRNDQAFEYLSSALEISLRNADTSQAIECYNILANLILGQQDEQGAIDYLERALELAEQSNREKQAVKLCVNLSILHGDVNVKLKYITKAIEGATKAKLKNHLAAAYTSRGDCHFFYLDDIEKAKLNYLQSIKVARSVKDSARMATSYYSLGRVYLYNNQADSAAHAYKFSMSWYEDNKASYPYYASLKGLSQALYQQQDYAAAYDSLMVSSDLAYNYYNQNLQQKLLEANTKFETAEKEKQISEQAFLLEKEKNKRIQQLLIVLGLLLIAALTFLWYYVNLRRRKLKTQHQLELQRMEAESLRELNSMKSRWFENISHDIRTPLTLISAPIKDLLKTTKSGTSQNLLKIADQNSQHLLSLTNEMLALAKLENNIIPIHITVKPTALELKKIIHSFDSFAGDKRVKIESDVQIDESTALAFDYDKYEKVFNNIIKNAIQYSPAESTVRINISRDKTSLMTSISDEGKGIPQDEIPLLFDKYFRASHQQSRQVAGSGLGLAIVQELLQLMNGTIEVKSEVGKGSQFLFGIPVDDSKEFPTSIDTESRSPSLQKEAETPIIDLGTAHLLIVEDNDEMLRYLQMALATEYEIDTANNAMLALQKLERKTYDMIISDIMMPGMDGFEFKKRVNTLTEHSHTAFMFLSARSLDEDKLKGLRLGVDDYMTKPFVTEELKIRIRNILMRNKIRLDALAEVEVISTRTVMDKGKLEIIEHARNVVMEHLGDIHFGVEQLADDLHYSPRQLNRRLKQECGLTTVQFILEIRLLQARKLMLNNQVYSVKEVQNRVGIHSQSYFSRKYSERFGVPPGSIIDK